MSQKPKNQHLTISIESTTIIRLMLVVVATLVLLAMVKQIAQPLVLIAVSFFLALALNPAVSRISHWFHLKSRAAATGIAYVMVVAFLAAFFSFVFPPLVRQTVDFIKDVPNSIQDYKKEGTPLNNFVHRYKLEEQADQLTANLNDRVKDIGKPVLSTASTIGSVLVSTITVLVLTFMMLVEGPLWIEKIAAMTDPAKRKHRLDLAYKMYRVVTSYANGQVIIAALGGLFATIALFILSQIFDASINPIALGGIISLFALLPLIGTTIGSAIVALACLLVSVPLAIAFAVYFIIYQQIENVSIQPYVQSRGNTLTPLMVFMAALIGVALGGILGALGAIPVAGCIKILADDYLERRRTRPSEA